MDWIFELDNGRRVFMRARENGSEGRRHVALKLLGLLLLVDREPEMEPPKGVWHRKYKPDVISGDGRTWCEAGKVARSKLIEVAGLRSVDILMVMKGSVNAARDLARGFPTDLRCDIQFYGWDSDGVDAIAELVSGHSYVSIRQVESCAGVERGTYEVSIDGEVVILHCTVFGPGCE